MQEYLQHMVSIGRNGIFLKKSGSMYSPGRSNSFYQSKVYQYSTVEVTGAQATTSLSGLVCKQYVSDSEYFLLVFRQNGLLCLVRCDHHTKENPPKIGEQIRVVHEGVWRSGKLKNASFV
jgi:hypothetical protein